MLQASGSAERIPGSRSPDLLVKHSDLKAPLLKISKRARRDGLCREMFNSGKYEIEIDH